MATKREHQDGSDEPGDARAHSCHVPRKTDWDDAEIVINIERTIPGTPLDDLLRKEQTRAVLDLLADYKQKLDKNGGAER